MLQLRVYEERQKTLKRRMEKLQREMNQPKAQEEERKVPRDGGNQPRNGQPAPNHHPNRIHNQHPNSVQEVIRGVEVVGAELSLGASGQSI